MMENICQNIQEQIIEYVTGTLPSKKIAILQAHISQCEVCRKYLEAHQADDKLFKDFAKTLQPVISRIEDNVIGAIYSEGTTKPINTISVLGVIMRNRITKFAVAAVIIIAVFIGINQFGVSIDGASVAWASVVEKLEIDIRASNTIHILLTICSKSPRIGEITEDVEAESVYIKGEQWLRKDPIAGKTMLEGDQTVYFFEDSCIGLNHDSKTWFEQPMSKEQERRKLYGFFDALVSGDFKKHLMIEGFTMSEAKVGQEIVEGEDATIYEFVGKPVETTEYEAKRAPTFRCWICNSDNRVVRLHQYIGTDEEPLISYDLIEYNIAIPTGTFDVVIPEGYVRELSSEEKIRMTVPESVIEVKQVYDQAKENFHDYRMMVFDYSGNIENRVARKGEKWRVDTYRQGIKDTGIFDTNGPSCFSDLWNQIEALQGCIERTVMNYNRGSARGFWPQEGVGGLPKTLYQGHVGFFDITNTLEYIAWSALPLTGPNSDIGLLPPSEKYPDCIGIRYSQRTESNKHHGYPQMSVLAIYWIDPSKDYICIRHEQHHRPTCLWKEDDNWFENEVTVQEHVMGGIFHYSSEITEITQLSQTSEGCWYPKEVQLQRYYLNDDGTRIVSSPEPEIKKIFIDTQVMAKPEFFQWPEQLPLPNLK